MKPRDLIVLAGTGVAVIALLGFLFLRPSPDTYVLPSQEITVEVARTLPQKVQGLSGVVLDEYESDGMLFVYADAAERQFWMKDMQFDLDVVWIQDGEVKKISHDVPAPAPGQAPARMSSSPFKVDEVLELPAGKAAEYGLNVGVLVEGLK